MNREQYLYLKLVEEASEISQVASKTSQFGTESVHPRRVEEGTNQEKLQSEFNDMLAIIDMLVEEGFINITQDKEAQLRKKAKVNKYYQMSKELGYVHESRENDRNTN